MSAKTRRKTQQTQETNGRGALAAAVARGEPLTLEMDASERGSKVLDELEMALCMDVASAPGTPHWTDDRGDPVRRAAIPALAQAVAHKMGWRVAEPITRWRVWLLTQAQLAEMLDITGRWLQELELRGLPCEGQRSTKLYPWPDALHWSTSYLLRQAEAEARGPYASRAAVRRLSPLIARAEHELRYAQDFAAATESAPGRRGRAGSRR